MIPLFKPYMPDDIMSSVQEILYSGKLAYGKWGEQFENEIKSYLGTSLVSLVNSYSSALNIALDVFEIGEGDEIIMSPMCCLQSTQPLAQKKIKIVWADVDPTTGTLDPTSVEQQITSKTKAIFHNQHLGYVGYIDEINEIANKYSLLTIDDCVDGMGGVYKGKKVGNCGSDATVISFHAVRLPNALECGAITFKDPKHFEKTKLHRDLGLDRTQFRKKNGEINELYDVTTAGYGATTNEVNTYIGYKQMSILDRLHEKQRSNARAWEKYFIHSGIECKPINIVNGTVPTYWVFGAFSDQKEDLIQSFKELGYMASGVHLNNNRYSLYGEYVDLPGVNSFYNRFLALPSGWWVNI
ncbi:aminotransferase class V-fold PLP-dependent enzyme [Chryseobacterium sp. SNU WT5]|nr:aminotransferase class V-fold PLP-dependent enzyme [Chryseobacterium sp. SNU WT5]